MLARFCPCRQSPKSCDRRTIEPNDDGCVTFDVGKRRLARPFFPFVAAVKRVLALLPCLDAREPAHQEP